MLAPTNRRASIFGDLGFGYPKPMLAPTRRHIGASIQNGFVMTKPVLAPTDRQTFFYRGKRTLTLILLHKTQTRASVFASFHTWFRFDLGESLCIWEWKIKYKKSNRNAKFNLSSRKLCEKIKSTDAYRKKISPQLVANEKSKNITIFKNFIHYLHLPL